MIDDDACMVSSSVVFRETALHTFQTTLGVRFRDLSLLNLSCIHRSFKNENPGPDGNNERLEFLGDAVLGMVVAERLYSAFSDRAEGELARIKSIVVSENTLADIAGRIGVDRLLLMGKGEEMSGGRRKKALLADAVEAVIGAYFLDSGFESAAQLVRYLIDPEIERVLENRHRRDYKTIIQQYVQKFHRGQPAYLQVECEGPDHEKLFKILCTCRGMSYGPGSGRTKKDAEQEAARMACESILSEGGLEAARIQQVGNF